MNKTVLSASSYNRRERPQSIPQANQNRAQTLVSSLAVDTDGTELSSRIVAQVTTKDKHLALDISELEGLNKEEQFKLFQDIDFKTLCDCLSTLHTEIQSLEIAIQTQEKIRNDAALLTAHLKATHEAAQKAMQAFQEGLGYIKEMEAHLQNFRALSSNMDGESLQNALLDTSELNLDSSLENCRKLQQHYHYIETWDKSMGAVKQEAKTLSEAQSHYEKDVSRLEALKDLAYRILAAFQAELYIKSEKDAKNVHTLLLRFPQARFESLKYLKIGRNLPKAFLSQDLKTHTVFTELERLVFNYTFGLRDLKLPIIHKATVKELTLSSPCLSSLEGVLLNKYRQLSKKGF